MCTDRYGQGVSTRTDKRTALLQRVVEHLAAHGIADMSLAPMAEQLGTSKRMLLYYFGSRLHQIFGAREVWRVAIWSTVAGGILHLIFQGQNPLVGASSIGLGFFVAVATASPESRMAPLPLRARNLRDGVILASVLLLILTPSLNLPLLSSMGRTLGELGFGDLFQIGHACHLGGALAGLLCMRRYLQRPITLAQLQRQRAIRENHEAA